MNLIEKWDHIFGLPSFLSLHVCNISHLSNWMTIQLTPLRTKLMQAESDRGTFAIDLLLIIPGIYSLL